VYASRIKNKFQELDREGRIGIILYATVGYPDMDATEELVPALAESGADIIELGVPFSDPLADGATIQETSHQALLNNVTLEDCIKLTARLRPRMPDTPLLFMGYYNPFLSYGLHEFARDANQAGLDGVIVPDLPTDEAGPLMDECRAASLDVVPLLAPTSVDSRIQLACESASGFIYCVSLTGVTGVVRDRLPEGVFDLLKRVRQHTSLPLAVGFGISRRDHVEALKGHADAAVVGAGLMRVVMEPPRSEMVQRAKEYVRSLAGSGNVTASEGATL
jgi:tryptophan synthase alpha chain